MRVRIGITLGDPAGIGPEVIRKALAAAALPNAELRIIGDEAGHQPGHPTADSARAARDYLEQAVAMGIAGDIDAVVTGPIHKARMYDIGFKFPGQTEFFAERCGIDDFAMLLTGGALTVALVTTHVPLSDVSRALSRDEIVRVGRLLRRFLHRRGIAHPRIAVAGLNPHAGESGAIGTEEIKIIAPAVEALQQEFAGDTTIAGPFSPDTIFHHAAAGDWNAVLCMYHDQGLIPLKLHAFHEGVNVTLGLPFPRTSPDHGTAFEIAGKGIARADSTVAAIRLAVELAQPARA